MPSTPILAKKLQAYGITMTEHLTVSDGLEQVAAAIAEMRKKPVDMILCTGGMSVDPDDNTPGAIARSGARIVTYGAAVLPGAMFLLGYYEDGQPVMGLPGCVMYAKATILDLILPRVAAGLQVTNQEIAVLDSYPKWELELGEPLGAFGGPILWVSHELGECCRNCARVCVMENGQTGALQPMQALLGTPASVSAARLTGCKNFFPLTKDGCVDGWPLQLPARRDGTATLAVPQTALELGGSGTPFRILRIIPDAGHAILLLQPEGAAEGSPVLRAECDAAGTYAAGQTLPVSFREEKLLFFEVLDKISESCYDGNTLKNGGPCHADRNEEMHPSAPRNHRPMLRRVAALAAFLCGSDRYPGGISGSEHGRHCHCCQV